jgi:hypothetical protein
MKSFSYLQLLKAADLTIVFQKDNTYTSPYTVMYSLCEVLSNGLVVRRTPTHCAVQDNVGVYHAVGFAGEGGQPGQWLVRWEWQMYFGGPTETRDDPFMVVDCASNPNDHLPRAKKDGWVD